MQKYVMNPNLFEQYFLHFAGKLADAPGAGHLAQLAQTAKAIPVPVLAGLTAKMARLNLPQGLFGGSVLAAMFCFAMPHRRRSLLSRLVVLLAAVGLLANVGCGLGKIPIDSSPETPTVTDPGTPLGTQMFILTVAGSDGTNTVRHTYQYQVTIQ